MMMEYMLPGLFLLVLGLVLLLNLLTLPANWVMVFLVFVWRFANPNPGAMDMAYFFSVISLAVTGEVIEFAAQAWGAKKYGSTNSGMVGGILGAIAGAILGAPLLFGLGALGGALGGAFAGAYLFERLRGRTAAEAWEAAKGTMVGRVFGIAIKCGIGAMILVLTYSAVWPDVTPLPPAPAVLPGRTF
jgi:uncharacterized protein YqgC (DUF456 family)